MTIRLASLGLGPLALLMMGCGGAEVRSKPMDASGPEVSVSFGSGPVAVFLARFAHELCGLHVACGLDRTVIDCERDIATYWEWAIRMRQAELDSGRMAWDPARAETCIASVQLAECPRLSSGLQPWSLGCPGLFTGAVLIGEPCVRDLECGTGYCQQPYCTEACCLGNCASRIPIGGRCNSGEESSCVAGAACGYDDNFEMGAWVCIQAGIEQGKPCFDGKSDPCKAGLRCDSNKQICMPYPKDGEPCDPAGVTCDRFGSYCDPGRNRCQALKQIGSSCNGNDCVGIAMCQGGKCVAKPGTGEPCTVPDGDIGLYRCR